jgi:hypothetical protein
MSHDRQGLDCFHRITKRGSSRKVGLNPRLSLPVIARDADRSLAETDVSERNQGNAHTAHRRDTQLLQDLTLCARLLVQQNPDWNTPIASIEFRKRRPDIAYRRHTDRFGQAFRRDSEANGKIATGIYP